MEKIRYRYIDILNVLACFAVVYHHTSGAYWAFEKARWWVGASLFQALTYFAVPIFFMICGVLLIDYNKKYTTKVYFRNRFKKIFIPFIAWNLIASFYIYYIGGIGIQDLLSPLTLINNIFNFKLVIFYWYFIALYTVYLTIPIIALIPEEKRKKAFLYICSLYFLLNVAFPLFFKLFLKNMTWNDEFNMPFGTSYIFYILAGYYIDRYEISKKMRSLIYILGLGGVLILFFGTWYLSYRDNYINETFKGYKGLACILYSVAIFTFIRYIKDGTFKDILFKIAKIFRKQSFAIYLIHFFVLEGLIHIFKLNIKSNKIIVLLGIAVFIISWIISYIIQKIPILKKIVP